jgi:hypothetical protein
MAWNSSDVSGLTSTFDFLSNLIEMDWIQLSTHSLTWMMLSRFWEINIIDFIFPHIISGSGPNMFFLSYCSSYSYLFDSLTILLDSSHHLIHFCAHSHFFHRSLVQVLLVMVQLQPEVWYHSDSVPLSFHDPVSSLMRFWCPWNPLVISSLKYSSKCHLNYSSEFFLIYSSFLFSLMCSQTTFACLTVSLYLFSPRYN